MLAKDLLSDIIPALRTSDTGAQGIKLDGDIPYITPAHLK
jgi:hypothetical protein